MGANDIHDDPVYIRDLSQDRSIVRISQVVRTPDGSIISQALFDHVFEIENALIVRMDIYYVAVTDRILYSG